MSAPEPEIRRPSEFPVESALIVDDDPVSLLTLKGVLNQLGIRTIDANDGSSAWEIMRTPACPPLILLDWMMPGMTGPELCKKLRVSNEHEIEPYVLILTARTENRDIVEGLDAGADDYLVKPFDREELKARIRAGRRMVQLQLSLQDRIRQIREARREISELRELIPICMYCKNVCDDDETWQQIESYVSRQSDVEFSHKICPRCLAEKHPELLDDRGA